LDVTFADTEFFEAVPATADPLAPEFLRGNFAVVTALGPTASSPRGVAYWINIKDELYPDFQPGIDLYDPDIAFRLPHSLRDNIPFRWVPSFTCTEGNYRNNEGPYRIAAGFPLALSTGLATNATGKSGAEFAPNLHLVSAEKIVSTSTSTRDWCAGAGVVAYELSSLAPRELRSALWADATLVSPGETFTVAWEGSLAAGDLRSQKTGGRVTIADGGRMQLDASGANLCGLGAQQGDIVRLLGCAINADCAVDETCYLHPQAPVGVSGMCIPRDKVIEFSADCQSLLTSVRRYTIVDITDEGAVIAPRPRTLPETPLAGCTDTSQCEAIQEKVLSAREDAAGQARGTRARHAYACETDGPMGGSPRCIEVCDDQTACELGTTCERSPGQAMGRCLLGPMPPPKCIERLQRYELRAGEAFTVVSSVAGYRNRAVVDPGTKACVVDPQKSPLLVARFGRNEPPCADTGGTAISPNPCTLPPAVIDPADCTNVIGGFAEPVALTSGVCYRPTHAVRIRTPGVSFDVVDLSLPLDGFPGVRYSPIQFGYGFQVQVAGGGSPFIETAIQANLPSRLRRGLRGSLPWVIDSGSSPVAGGTRGQIIQLIGNASGGAAADVRLR
ncbi:MAG TPA: hypothetical protein VKE22_01995, partial [Haliangiales bacterium]|nr:hypothetical protein [Haliangiales bacterium]